LIDSSILLSNEGKERAVPLGGGGECSEEQAHRKAPPQNQSRSGLEEVFYWVMT